MAIRTLDEDEDGSQGGIETIRRNTNLLLIFKRFNQLTGS